MPDLPTKPGFYWAKWRIAEAGTLEGDELTPSDDWEVVRVFENADETDPEHLRVMVPGVVMCQALGNFVWGFGPLEGPPKEIPSARVTETPHAT